MTPAPRRRRHDDDEEPENHERWLVTYADMLTLLMVLFIVMFAMSSVDQKKYNALRSGLADGFGQKSSYMKGSDSILDEDGSSITSELSTEETYQKLPPAQKAVVAAAATQQDLPQEQYAEALAEADRLEKIRQRIERVLRRHGLADDVQTAIDERGLVVSLVSRHVVFANDVARLSPRGERVVDVLAPVLREIPDDLRIDGHTNQIDVHPKYYATDWDLSAARAVTVLRRLNERDGVADTRLSMSAFGHEQPLRDPHLPGSQEVNKRVDIIVLSQLDAASRELMARLAHTRATSLGSQTTQTTTHEEVSR
jgi:chemotaxis protein MotB